MDRLEAMSMLVAAADAGSLSAASRRLRIPLPTVSRNVAELESHLNTSLLIRSRKGLALTESGKSFVASARAILENVAEAERSAAGEYVAPTGDIVVAAPILFGRLHVLPVIVEFLRAYPDVNVHFVQSDRVSPFLEDQLDVAFRIGHLPDSSLTATQLGTVRQVICASPAYLKANGTPVRPTDLARYDCITADSLAERDRWQFQDGRRRVAVPARSRLLINTLEAGIDAAIAGAGLVRALSYQVVAHVRAGSLKVVLSNYEPAPWPVHLLYNGQNRTPLKLRAFMDFAVPRLRKSIAKSAI